jgi:hypothetical protein
VPIIQRALDTMPRQSSSPTGNEAFDAQALFDRLSLHQAIMWLCGVDLGKAEKGRGEEWLEARDGLGEALSTAGAIVGRRLKVGSLWVSRAAVQ